MSIEKFQTMNELAQNIREKVGRLEEGKLLAEELGSLSQELRDLYDRIVVLQYKAMEKGLKIHPETVKPVETPKPVEQVPAFKISVAEVKPEPKIIENPIPVAKVEPSPELSQLSNPQPETASPKSIAEKYAAEQKTSIAEKFATEQKLTLADKLVSTGTWFLQKWNGIKKRN